MKYILMMNATKADCDWYVRWSKRDLQANAAFMRAFSTELKNSAAFVTTEGLAFPDQAKIVRAGGDGLPITDGVFPEAKEFLMGYWVVDVESPEQAYSLAARASAAPGPEHPSGKALSIEVREIMSAPPEEFA